MEELINIYKKSKEKIDKSPGSMYNSFRSKVYNQKGKDIGFPDSWKTFDGFKSEMSEGWERGLLLVRKDCDLPYSKENCIWIEKGLEKIGLLPKLEYNGETKTLVEWCSELNLNQAGVNQRYSKRATLTPNEILFGKKRVNKRDLLNCVELEYQAQRVKASKMVSSYRIRDKSKNLDCNLDIEFMLDIMTKPCIYCGDVYFIGADRIDNNIGHTKLNVVPCCYTCNTARNNNFTHNEMFILGETIKQIKLNRNEAK